MSVLHRIIHEYAYGPCKGYMCLNFAFLDEFCSEECAENVLFFSKNTHYQCHGCQNLLKPGFCEMMLMTSETDQTDPQWKWYAIQDLFCDDLSH